MDPSKPFDKYVCFQFRKKSAKGLLADQEHAFRIRFVVGAGRVVFEVFKGGLKRSTIGFSS